MRNAFLMRLLATLFADLKCSQQPSALITFDIDSLDTTTVDPQWPDIYQFVTSETSLGYCGNYIGFNTTSKSCCYSSLDLEASNGVGSVVFDFGLQNQQAADGHTYCQVNGSPFGYKEVLVSETCFKGLLCNKGQLSVYNDAQCKSNVLETWNLGQPKQFNSTILGPFQGAYKTLQGNRTVSWIAYLPANLLVPLFDNTFDLLSLSVGVGGVLIALAAWLYTIKKVWIDERRKAWNYLSLLIQFMWLAYASLQLGYWVIVFRDDIALAVYGQVLKTVFNLSTLGSTIGTTWLLVVPIFCGESRVWGLGLTLLLLIFHVGFAGAGYLFYYCNYPVGHQQLADFLIKWNQYAPYWVLCMLIWDSVPPIVISIQAVGRQLEVQSLWQRAKRLSRMDPWLGPVLLLQLVIFITYFVTRWAVYLEWIGSDRNQLAMGNFLTFCLVMHSALVMRTLGTIKIAIRALSSRSTPVGISSRKSRPDVVYF
ncbi:hypothetical protein EDD86DRAFT_217086 [Gorgonomyces haynaldii]|nr:hypothetical protein EDD86DRAFT_217086 [Gorgonomyces haynaldii]